MKMKDWLFGILVRPRAGLVPSGSVCASLLGFLVICALPSSSPAWQINNDSPRCNGGTPAVRIWWNQPWSGSGFTYTVYRDNFYYAGPYSQRFFDNTLNVQAGTWYVYSVKAEDGTGQQEFSDNLWVYIPSDVCPLPAAICRSPTSLTQSVTQGQNAPSQSFSVWNCGGGTLSYSISDNNVTWLSEFPTSGTSTFESDTISVDYSTASLAVGTYNATITISASGLSSQTISVSLTVNPPPPAICRSPTSLTQTVTQGQNAPSQSFSVWNCGSGTLSYSISDNNVTWLSEFPPSGTSTFETDTISVDYSTASLSAGTYSATITISASGISSQTIPVTLTVNPTPPEITVTWNGSPIADGDTTPTTSDGTDFGSVVEGQPGPSREFTVRNDGGSTLTLGIVSVPSGFTVTEGLSTSLAPNASDTFTIRLDSTTTGTKNGQISFSNNDSNENPFNFAITGIVNGADPDDQISEAVPFGEVTNTLSRLNAITTPGTDVDMYSFQVAAGQRISFDIDLVAGSALNSHLRLFNASGVQLATSDNAAGPGEPAGPESYLEYTFTSGGTHYVGVSASPNSNYDPVSGTGDTAGSTTGEYMLVLSPGLAGSVRRNGETTDYLVDILRVDSPIGSYPRAIDPQKKTWIIVHGWNSSRAADNISNLVQAVASHRPGDQVLTLDWSSAAITGAGACRASIAIEPVAEWASDALQDYQFPNGNLNFIGHSYGSYVSAETAERITGGVDTIVGLDPAAHFAPCAYNPNSEVDFRSVSQFSWAFHTSTCGSEFTPTTAHECFVIPHDHILFCPIPPSLSEHSHAIDVFISMLMNSGGGVSQLFQLSRLSSHTPGPWCPDRYTSHAEPVGGTGDPGYEGIIEPTPDGLSPELITYVVNCGTGQETNVVEIPDSTNPSITITTPTTDPAYESPSRVLDLFGSASDNVRVKRVNWVNDRGGSGLAAGTGNWIAGPISLQEGMNVITVTARDVAGNTATDTITVTYLPVILTVLSSNADSGVLIGVAPSDNNLQSDGTTTFTRKYDKTTFVTLLAPAVAGCNHFVKWQRDGSDWAASTTTTVTMDAAHSMSAIYAPRPQSVIFVDCNYSGGSPDGSQARPFRTVQEAYNSSCNNDTLRMNVCNYNETITINRFLRLEATNGIVHIGR